MTRDSTGAFRRGQCPGADVLARPNPGLLGSGFEGFKLGGRQAHGDDFGARVVARRSAGPRCHDSTIAYTERLDQSDLDVYDKAVTDLVIIKEAAARCGWEITATGLGDLDAGSSQKLSMTRGGRVLQAGFDRNGTCQVAGTGQRLWNGRPDELVRRLLERMV